jgi:hypothetical protein
MFDDNEILEFEDSANKTLPDFMPKKMRWKKDERFYRWIEFRCFQKVSLALSNTQIVSNVNDSYVIDFVKKSNLFVKQFFEIYIQLFESGSVWLGLDEMKNFIWSACETEQCNLRYFDDYYFRESITRRQIIKTLYEDFNNICSAEKDIIENRGFLGSIAPQAQRDGLVVGKKQKEEAMSFWQKAGGLLKNKFKIMFSAFPLQYTKFDLPIEQLKLQERKIQCKIDIGDVFGIPPELLPKEYSAKYDNLNISIQMFYQNDIMPFIYQIMEQLLKFAPYSYSVSIETISVQFPTVPAMQELLNKESERKMQEIDREILMFEKGLQTAEETKLNILKIKQQ